MKKTWLNLLLVVAMVLVTATPAFAQDPAIPDGVPDHAQTDDTVPADLPDGKGGLPDGFDVVSQVFLPMATLSDVDASVEALSEEEAAAVAADAVQAAALSELALAEPIVLAEGAAPLRSRAAANGRVDVVVRMTQSSVAQVVGAAAEDEVVAAEVQDEVQAAAASQQDQVIAWVKKNDPSAQVLGRMKVALNAVIFNVDAKVLPALATVPGVAAINPVIDYELDLTETVPAIGGTATHAMGFRGQGVIVAVLDSGIDYTHANLGGDGTLAAYTAAYSNPAARDGLFPTTKVIDGFDFVGETWPNTPATTPDLDPIDFEGHGTHVADIIAGVNGVAPDAKLVAVKVCSAVASSCNGTALLLGMEFALDRNGDGKMNDAVDVINMSLGSSYGQIQDDLTLASENAVKAGVVVVTSAGNSADRPYIVGSPSIGPSVISVAQTTVPSDESLILTAPGIPSPIQLVFQPWSVVQADTISAPIEYPTTNADACAAYPAGSLAGKIVVVDRGTCNISIKAENVGNAGGLVAIIANNARQGPGDPPPSFSYGGGTITIPAYSATQADGLLVKAAKGKIGTIDPDAAVNIYMSMVASSSRGPSYSLQSIKPDIGAPGASMSAEVGTGTGETAFGGTSGAAPMVSGAAALLLSAKPNLKPFEVRALLMNNAETDIFVNPVKQPGYLAPITRIGAGEVRVNDAVTAKVVAYEKSTKQGSLSFGYNALTSDVKFKATIEVKNYSNQQQRYYISRATRYANDAWGNSFGVNLQAPREVSVPARGTGKFDVTLYVYATELPNWLLNGGFNGGDGWLLQDVEFDGYITLTEKNGTDSLNIPWHILPRKAAGLTTRDTSLNVRNPKQLTLTNNGAADGIGELFPLLGTSPRIPNSQLPGLGDNFAVVDLRAVGVRSAVTANGNVLQIGITTFGTRSHPAYPAEFDVYIDTNNDGKDDFVLYTAENGGFAATGQVLVYVVNLANGAGGAYFYADADLNSANIIMTAPMSVLGITPATKITVHVYAFDNYFTGNLTDYIENMVVTPSTPKYGPIGTTFPVTPKAYTSFPVYSVPGGAAASPSQTGLLVLYRNQKPGFEAEVVQVRP